MNPFSRVKRASLALVLASLLAAEVNALEWETSQNLRSAALSVEQGHQPGFTLLSGEQTGITFSNLLSQARYTTNQIYLNGSGVTAGDVDGDGLSDLYFCGLDSGNALYRNLGNWTFTNITAAAGVACAGLASTGAALADIDGDGDLDLVVNSVAGGTHLFLNDGQAHFTPRTVLNEHRGGMSLALADIDGNGTLDLYICNYRPTTLRDQPGTNFRVNIVDGQPVVAFVNGQSTTNAALQGRFSATASGNIAEHGEPDAFYRNDGNANFSPIPFTSGAFLNEEGQPLNAPPYDWGLSVLFRDLNEDGAPDLYVCNDFESVDHIWLNDGRGGFRALPRINLRNISKFSMGIDVADIDRDGHDDLLILDMLSRNPVTRLTRADKTMETTPVGVIENRPQLTRNTLHLNRGDGTYSEIACFAGLSASEWSWTPVFLDVDLDGFEDLLITTGHGRDDMDIDNGLRIERARRTQKMPVAEELAMRKTSPKLPCPRLAFRNRGDLHFEEMGAKWGFDQIGIAHGMCLADLDNDGDLDVIVNNLNAPAGIYRNNSSAPRVAVRLKGAGANTRGIGAKIMLSGGPVPRQSQEMICGGRYLSSDDALRVFAASAKEMRLEVTWRSGKKSTVEGVRANRIYEVAEAGAVEAPSAAPAPPVPLFEDASALLGHQHHEELFDDFARQGLLPNRLSQLGPGVSWIDLNGAGRDDLVIGSGRGGALAVYENNSGFRKSTTTPFSQTVTRDQTTLLGFPAGNNRIVLLAGSANYEDGLPTGSSVRLYEADTPKIQDPLPAQPASTGPLALADLDGDGSLELFVGGRVLPGRYPEAASSQLWKQREGKWILDEPNSAVLKQAGLVSGALWTDLNRDGYPELVLACEWGPVKIFQNEKGHLRDATARWGLDKRIGWWNGVTAGDFDGDGQMDLVVSNWGLNTKYRVAGDHGPRLYYGPWGGSGEIEMIEASFDPASGKWLPERDLNSVGRSLPFVREKFRTHRAYAEAGVDQILGERLKEGRVLEANWLETTVFLNRGDHFELGTLPVSAQFTPAFGVNVADFDGDGREDIFLSQNFFAVQPQTGRNDAGRGLLLRGRGNGTFEALDGSLSGIKVYGEQRGSAVADYDADGRVDLVVTQNGAETKLYHNLGAKPGMRIRLQGTANNPQAIGAILRVTQQNKPGPAREIHAGGGYWSQDSAVQVISAPDSPAQIEILWPGGKTSLHPLLTGTNEVTVPFPGGAVPAK